VPHDWVAFAEIGLGGELRPVTQTEARLREAARLGFKKALIAREEPKSMERLSKLGIEICPMATLEDALKELADA
jgi:DNA repair protein RadA/Sms